MSRSLFSRLYSQSQSESGLNKRENYATELLAFCLQADLTFRNRFLNLVEVSCTDDIEIATQYRESAVGIFDILICDGKYVIIIIECKLDSSFGKTQQSRYAKYLSEQPSATKRLVYLTKNAYSEDNDNDNKCFKHLRWFEIYRILEEDNIVSKEFKLYLNEQNMSNLTPFLPAERNAIQDYLTFLSKTNDFFDKVKEALQPLGFSSLRRDSKIEEAHIGRKFRYEELTIWVGFYQYDSNEEMQLGLSIDDLKIKSKAYTRYHSKLVNIGWNFYKHDDNKGLTYHINRDMSTFFNEGQFDNEVALSFISDAIKKLIAQEAVTATVSAPLLTGQLFKGN